MKKICSLNNIPTAKFKICSNNIDINKFLKTCSFPVVLKADGLASGKGVSICKNKNQVIKSSSEIFRGKFNSSRKVVLEEFLEGEEASYFLIVDKNSFKFWPFLCFWNGPKKRTLYRGPSQPNWGIWPCSYCYWYER